MIRGENLAFLCANLLIGRAEVMVDNKRLFWKILSGTLIFCYLEFVLLFAIFRPEICMDITWVHETWFSFASKNTCIIRMRQPAMIWLETTFFSLLALFGYSFRDSAAKSPENNLADFKNAMMGINQKYYWICIVPWIITFGQNWSMNIFEYLIFFYKEKIYDTENCVSCFKWLIAYIVVQLLLASGVCYVALQGIFAMIKINDENMLWEKRKRSLVPDNSDTAFEVTFSQN
uniref:Uncharacterized protein n=1 Tax=Glossina brevipalpis TaxID=37001 RepID=A0A1A9WN29_9MUSC